jgi:hypothetical protein
MGDGAKPCQSVSALMNVPTEEYLDVVESKKEDTDNLGRSDQYPNSPKRIV